MEKTGWILKTNLSEHPAIIAWNKISPRRVEPKQIEVLKKVEKGSVYRIVGVGPGKTAVIAKMILRPEKAEIERTVYEQILAYLPIETVDYYGFFEEDEGRINWLFLEDIGNNRYSPLDKDQQKLVANWLAVMNTAAENVSVQPCLPSREADHYLRYLQSILETIPQIRAFSSLNPNDLAVIKNIVSMCELLKERWDQVELFCTQMPRTLVHGDCLTRNIHVRKNAAGLSVLPFDWGGAGWGLPGTDLGQSGLPYKSVPPTNPDIGTYLEFVKDRWSYFDIEITQQLANLGKMFWALKVICLVLPEFDQKWATIEYIISDFRVYESVLADSIILSMWDS